MTETRVFATDDASKELTPATPLLQDATATELQGMGLKGIDVGAMIPEQVCPETQRR